MSAAMLFTVFFPVLFPWLAQRIHRLPGVPGFFSPVVLCYIFGILAGNLLSDFVVLKLAENIAAGAMLLALPLLLFGSNLRENWRLAGPGLLAFGLCAVAGMLATAFTAWYFRAELPNGWQAAGMLTGLFTGGSPNMQAIGIALHAPSDFVVILQASDILVGGAYLILLMTVVHPFLGRFLPSFQHHASPVVAPEGDATSKRAGSWPSWAPLLVSVLLVACSAGITKLLTGAITDTTLLILCITTLSLLASFYQPLALSPKAYDHGEYFLFIFCVALGMQARFSGMVAEGGVLFKFCLLAFVVTILVHYLLVALFKVDRDTAIISSVAAIYGPAFIPQITTAIRNQRLLAPGIALGLLGLAVGNYLGISLAYLARWWMGTQ